jgi:lysozyme
MFQYSEAGISKTKEFEGLRLAAYQDVGGVWTIGYGHTGKGVSRGRTITQAEADELLRADIQWAVDCVNKAVTVPINQNQFDAMVDFTFNVGCGAFRSSTLLRRLTAGDTIGAADEFLRWKFVNKVESAGLLRRRKADRELFLTPPPEAAGGSGGAL